MTHDNNTPIDITDVIQTPLNAAATDATGVTTATTKITASTAAATTITILPAGNAADETTRRSLFGAGLYQTGSVSASASAPVAVQTPPASSPCLEENPWHKFPFSGFLAMLSGLITLVIDSMATSIYTSKKAVGIVPHGHGHGPGNGVTLPTKDDDSESAQLLRYRVIAMVLELGIVVHSVVIGLSLGATSDTCTIKGLIAALCFHQMFEGMGLGGCILQAEDNSPSALITVGLLNACSAGLLIYMALVDLLAAEFMGPKLQGSVKMQIKCFIAALLGCGGLVACRLSPNGLK
uniref:Uncharacterized protein n=1 Tax=Brassica oleracea var. oleracea TaxID=109376 RepID=A0A0D3A4H2_BRAOL